MASKVQSIFIVLSLFGSNALTAGCLEACSNPRNSCYTFREEGLYRRYAQRHVNLPYYCDTIHKIQRSLSKKQKLSRKRKYVLIFIITRSRCSFFKMISNKHSFHQAVGPHDFKVKCRDSFMMVMGVIIVLLGNLFIIVQEGVWGHITSSRQDTFSRLRFTP